MISLAPKYSKFHSHLGEIRKIFGKKQFLIRLYKRIFLRHGIKKFITNLMSLGKITHLQTRLLDLIYRHCRFHARSAFLSQGTMGAILGVTREAINRNLKLLEKASLIRWVGTHTYASRTRCAKMVETNCYVTRWNDKYKFEAAVTIGPSAEECRKYLENSVKSFKPSFGSHNRVENSLLRKLSKENTPPNRNSDNCFRNSATRKTDNKVPDSFQTRNLTSGELQETNKVHRQSNTIKNIDSGNPHSNNSFRDTSMGFFAELETTKRNSRFTEFDYASATRLRNAIVKGKYIFGSSLGSLDSWANEFYQLRKYTTEQTITDVLNWYLRNIGGRWIPQCYSAISFRKKFAYLLVKMNHEVEDKKANEIRELTKSEKEFIKETMLWEWKNKNITPEKIKLALTKTIDGYKKFHKAVIQTSAELSSKSQIHEYYLDLMRSSLSIPEEFGKETITNIFHGLDNWDKWGGNIVKACFDVSNEEHIEKEIAKLVKSAGAGLEDKYILSIITSIKTKLRG